MASLMAAPTWGGMKLGIVFSGVVGDEGKSEGRYMDLDYLLLIYHAPSPSIAYIDV